MHFPCDIRRQLSEVTEHTQTFTNSKKGKKPNPKVSFPVSEPDLFESGCQTLTLCLNAELLCNIVRSPF